jgi:hypothetical protein
MLNRVGDILRFTKHLIKDLLISSARTRRCFDQLGDLALSNTKSDSDRSAGSGALDLAHPGSDLALKHLDHEPNGFRCRSI